MCVSIYCWTIACHITQTMHDENFSSRICSIDKECNHNFRSTHKVRPFKNLTSTLWPIQTNNPWRTLLLYYPTASFTCGFEWDNIHSPWICFYYYYRIWLAPFLASFQGILEAINDQATWKAWEQGYNFLLRPFRPGGGRTYKNQTSDLVKESLLLVLLWHTEADPRAKLNRIAENVGLVCLIGSGM